MGEMCYVKKEESPGEEVAEVSRCARQQLGSRCFGAAPVIALACVTAGNRTAFWCL